jgi:hypothetical protein
MNSAVNARTPLLDRDVIDLDPAFSQQLLQVAVGQAEAQIPAQRHGDHLTRDRCPAGADGSYLDLTIRAVSRHD